MKQNLLVRTFFFLVCLNLTPAFAQQEPSQEALKKQFSTAYKAYQKAVSDGSYEELLETALDALEKGEKIYPENSKTMATLQYNAGLAIISSTYEKKEAKALLQRSLSTLEKIHGENAVELVDVLMTLGHANQIVDSPARKMHYTRALKIIGSQKDTTPITLAHTNFQIGKNLLDENRSPSAEAYLKEAERIYREELPEDHFAIGLASFYLAKMSMSKKKYRRAEPYLLEAMEIFDFSGKKDTNMQLMVHAFLVQVYENSNRREKANMHSQAIGRATSWNSNQKPIPIFKGNLIYPERAAAVAKDGFVRLIFTVDENGFVVDPKVESAAGGKQFGKAALDSIKQWRFVPRFENDQAVATPNVTWDFNFFIER